MCQHKDEMISDIRMMLGGMLAEMNWRALVVGGGERRGREADPPIHRWLHTITSLHQKLVSFGFGAQPNLFGTQPPIQRLLYIILPLETHWFHLEIKARIYYIYFERKLAIFLKENGHQIMCIDN